jgi:hypothetical protein
MRLLVGSFWRAVGYCLHPRVIALSILPLVLMVALSFALGYLFWDAAVAQVLAWLEAQALFTFATSWLASLGLDSMGAVLAPLLVLALATPLIVVLSLLLVGIFMMPSLVDLVAQRRFPALQRRQGGGFFSSLAWSLGSTLLALLALLASVPLWLVPPLVLVLPPVIWGWLSYRVFAFDALAEHASASERQQLLQRHRTVLLVMGVLSGYLGAAPSLLWASGAMFIALAPLLVPLAIWLYALVFAFSSLWFVHFLLEALQALRQAEAPVPADPHRPNTLDGAHQPSVLSGGGMVIDVDARPLP